MHAQHHAGKPHEEHNEHGYNPGPRFLNTRGDQTPNCNCILRVSGWGTKRCFCCVSGDFIRHPEWARQMENPFEIAIDHTTYHQYDACSQPKCMINAPVQGREYQQIEFFIPQKSESLHQSDKSLSKGLQNKDEGDASFKNGIHRCLLSSFMFLDKLIN